MSSALLGIPWGILTVIHIWLHRSYAQIFPEYFDFLVVLPLFGAHFVDMFSLPVTKLECAAVGKKMNLYRNFCVLGDFGFMALASYYYQIMSSLSNSVVIEMITAHILVQNSTKTNV